MTIKTLLGQLQANWRRIVVLHLMFTLFATAVLTPLFGVLLQTSLALTGSEALVDQEIARTLLSPIGLLGAAMLFAVFLAITSLELGALTLISLGSLKGKNFSPASAARYSIMRAHLLLNVTFRLTLYVLAYLLPYLAIVALLAFSQLTDYDINYYLAEQPPEFLWVVGAAVVLALPLIWLLGQRLIDWSLVLPLVLFAGQPPAVAFSRSRTLVAQHKRACVQSLLTWLTLVLVLLAIPAIVLNLGMDYVLTYPSTKLTTLAAMLGILGACWAALSFIVAAMNLASFSLVIADLYRQCAGDSQVAPEIATSQQSSVSRTSWTPMRIGIACALLTLACVAALSAILRSVSLDDEVLVIAHRGAAGSAPENTIASIERAIQDGADWVEIDVQESLDGQVVVVHDSDFMKLAGDPIKVWEADIARLKQIDVGSWFDPRFKDERVPTLAEVLALIKAANSRLVIELKYYGHDEDLERRVVELVEAADMADRVAVMSLKLKGVNKLKELRPQWTGGLLAATAVGDITRLETDFLAVNQNMARPAFIRQAHRAGKAVFVWTVNDPLTLSHWMSMGVDGVITDEPAIAREILRQRAELTPAQRLLLAGVMFFGKPESIKKYRDNSP